jgi:transposase-like protein
LGSGNQERNREGGRAVEAKASDCLVKYAELRTEDGLKRVVRQGHLPDRSIMAGIGAVKVRQPRLRDRDPDAGDRVVKFTPAILPRYARRSKSLEVLLPILYLKGVSTGDFDEALSALLGKDAPGLSASTIARLKGVWMGEHKDWKGRDLSAKHYVYVWADGIHLQARLEDDAQCILVLIGATPEGKKELVGFTDGLRESAESWRGLLLDLQNAACDARRSWLSATAHSAFGRRWARSGRPPSTKEVGFTKPRMC